MFQRQCTTGKISSGETAIDILDIDLEGHDELIVNTLDWERYKPSFVLLELHKDCVEEVLLSDMYRKMRSCGYKMIRISIQPVFFNVLIWTERDQHT